MTVQTHKTLKVYVAVPGFPNYEFSRRGNLRNIATHQILKPAKGIYSLSNAGKKKSMGRVALNKLVFAPAE